MSLILNDTLKLRGTHIWLLVVGLPLVAAGLGTFNYWANAEVLDSDWQSLWSQIGLFHGFFFLSLAIAVCASAVWRTEHRGHNWNTMMTAPRHLGQLVAAKIVVLGGLVVLMQVWLLVLGLVAGWGLGLSGLPPWELPTAVMVSVVPGIAVAAWQSTLSMVIRNFAAPIGIALGVCVVSTGLVVSGHPELAHLVPPALVTVTMSLGSSAVADAAAMTAGVVGRIVLASGLSTVLAWGVATGILLRRDIAA